MPNVTPEMLSTLSSTASAHSYSWSAKATRHHELTSKAKTKDKMQIRPNPTHETTTRDAKPPTCTPIACNELILNQNTIDYKLRCVADCLVHLNRPNQEIALSRKNLELNRSNNDWNKISTDKSLCVIKDQPEAAAAREDRRIRKIVKIYSMLMKLSPIEAQLRFGAQTTTSTNNLVRLFSEKNFCPLEARQRVLDLIENHLGGYCDSIHSLRCILRSNEMIGVIAAFSEVIKKTLAYNCSKMHDDLRNSEIAVASGNFEFRIVQEWKL